MVNKSTLLKKLSSYSALASVAIAAAQKADGQIVYTAIDPPKVLVIDSFMYLDPNNDGVDDFVIAMPPQFKTSQSTLSEVYAFMSVRNSNFIERDTVHKTSSNLASLLKANNYKSVIGADKSSQWETGGELDYWTFKKLKNGNNFAGKGDKYVGLQLKNAGKTYYGWVRVNLTTKCDTLIVKDYAYDTIPGQSITAGEGQPATGIAPINSVSAILESSNPNPASTISNIIYTIPVYSSVTITLRDVMGRKIETVLDNAMQLPGRHTIPIDVSMLSSGIYFYELTANGQTYTQKFAVTH
jgi:hypothetical protein